MSLYDENLFCNDFFDDAYISSIRDASSTPHSIENNDDPSIQDTEIFSPPPVESICQT